MWDHIFTCRRNSFPFISQDPSFLSHLAFFSPFLFFVQPLANSLSFSSTLTCSFLSGIMLEHTCAVFPSTTQPILCSSSSPASPILFPISATQYFKMRSGLPLVPVLEVSCQYAVSSLGQTAEVYLFIAWQQRKNPAQTARCRYRCSTKVRTFVSHDISKGGSLWPTSHRSGCSGEYFPRHCVAHWMFLLSLPMNRSFRSRCCNRCREGPLSHNSACELCLLVRLLVLSFTFVTMRSNSWRKVSKEVPPCHPCIDMAVIGRVMWKSKAWKTTKHYVICSDQ